jgi:hypothetical protein
MPGLGEDRGTLNGGALNSDNMLSTVDRRDEEVFTDGA